MHEKRRTIFQAITLISLKTEKIAVKISASPDKWKTFYIPKEFLF